jgi:hypothetical protein
VWDTFIWGGEADMLRCRLEALDNSPVYRHVIVEADRDHQGNPKPLAYGHWKDLLAPWKDKIIYLPMRDTLPPPEAGLDPWVREHMMRSQLWAALTEADFRDFVLLADVDEIPSASALEYMGRDPADDATMVAFEMDLCMFAVDWMCPEPTPISVGGPKGCLSDLPTQRNNAYRERLPLIRDAGFHFTWLGGPRAIHAKASQFCHLELREMILHSNAERLLYEQGYTWHGDPAPYPPREATVQQREVSWKEMDERYPDYIRHARCPGEWFRPGPGELDTWPDRPIP